MMVKNRSGFIVLAAVSAVVLTTFGVLSFFSMSVREEVQTVLSTSSLELASDLPFYRRKAEALERILSNMTDTYRPSLTGMAFASQLPGMASKFGLANMTVDILGTSIEKHTEISELRVGFRSDFRHAMMLLNFLENGSLPVRIIDAAIRSENGLLNVTITLCLYRPLPEDGK